MPQVGDSDWCDNEENTMKYQFEQVELVQLKHRIHFQHDPFLKLLVASPNAYQCTRGALFWKQLPKRLNQKHKN